MKSGIWKNKTKRWLIGPITGCLMLFLIACGTKAPMVVTKTKRMPVLPPKEWMKPIKEPKIQGDQNRDLWILLEQQDKTIDKFQIRLKKLRQWREENARD
jgi:hypothetical protein